ncbi:hypothetical protein PMAYCL1PPCAC_08192, partial [Pristionchus mayeri]
WSSTKQQPDSGISQPVIPVTTVSHWHWVDEFAKESFLGLFVIHTYAVLVGHLLATEGWRYAALSTFLMCFGL